MALLNPDYLKEDVHIKAILDRVVEAKVEPYHTGADRDIRSIVAFCQVNINDVPVDGSGYITSDALIDYGVACFNVRILTGFHGAKEGEKDIYFDKLQYWMAERESRKSLVTKGSIINGFHDATSGDPLPIDDFIQEAPYIV